MSLIVEQSLNNARWNFPSVGDAQVTRMAQTHGLPEFVARLLCQRGVGPEDVNTFLYPTLRDHFPDPFSLKGMKELAEDVVSRMTGDAKIGVFADFDVDGATSAAILTRFFRHFGLDVPVYIPDRLSEGYGPSAQAMHSLKDQGAEFVLMADCGTTSFEPIAAGQAMGLSIAVLDHHEAEDKLPNAAHIINPKRKDDTSGLTMLAACGVSFMVCVAINKALREAGYYKETGLDEPPLKSWMDIVALGTVCDMVPLLGVNRLFVRTGFQQMASWDNPGLKALAEVGNIQNAPEPSHAGFVLGPRINAGSRVHRSDLGARLLSTDDAQEALQIAWRLEDCNKQRRDIQAKMMDQAIAKVSEAGLHENAVIIVDDKDWHPGIAGLVAGRLKERFGKPSIVVTYAENTDGVLEGRGSGRSIKGVNLAQSFIDARHEDLLVKGGGHAMAGGFTVLPEKLEDFKAFLSRHIGAQMQDIDTTPELLIDGTATVQSARVEFVKLLQDNVGPFGMGNPEPVFALANVRLFKVDVLKEAHIRLQLADWEGGSWMKAMFFNGVGTALGQAMLKQNQQPFHLAGKFQINCWQGRESAEFHIMDGALAMEQVGAEQGSAQSAGFA